MSSDSAAYIRNQPDNFRWVNIRYFYFRSSPLKPFGRPLVPHTIFFLVKGRPREFLRNPLKRNTIGMLLIAKVTLRDCATWEHLKYLLTSWSYKYVSRRSLERISTLVPISVTERIKVFAVCGCKAPPYNIEKNITESGLEACNLAGAAA